MRNGSDPESFRALVHGLCATMRTQQGVHECQAYWANEFDVRVETLAEETYYHRPPAPELCVQLYRLSSLADYTGTFSW